VAATFAVFEPGLIATAYDRGRARVGRAELLAVLDDSVAASLRQRLGTEAADADVARAVGALRRAVDGADGAARPLFSGVRSLGWPGDPLAQLWRGCHALREHRGDGHLAAALAAGYDPVELNILTELWHGYPLGAYSGTRGWPEPRTAAALASLRARGLLDGEGLSAAGMHARDELEARTDATEASVVEAVGADLDWLTAQLARWSASCTSNGAFPLDPRKRAAG
jgi:hypothetical protein